MNYYKKGRRAADRNRDRLAETYFQRGLLHGDLKCAYGVFALRMKTGADAREAWESFVQMLPQICLLAEQRDGDACFILGRCYETGCGGETDMELAKRWYTAGALLGCLDAAYDLGCLYCRMGGRENVQRGIGWFRLAAEKNHKEAQQGLVRAYTLLGQGRRALFWLKRARRGGSAFLKEQYRKELQ